MKILLALLLFVVSIGLLSTASAHKSEVFGDYKVEVGWDSEPPIAGTSNKITLMITYAQPSEKTDGTEIPPEQYGKGIPGLVSDLDVSVTLNKEKTQLSLVEDEKIPGKYYADFTPTHDGYPIVHLFTTINERQIEVDFHPERVENGAIIQAITSDGTISVDIVATAPQPDRWMLILLEFTDSQGNPIPNVNYDIMATQNKTQVLSKSDLHSLDGYAKHTTTKLDSEEPVEIQIKILGIGPIDDRENWTGPNDVIAVNVVPEFGAVALAVLGVLASCVIAVTLWGKSANVLSEQSKISGNNNVIT